MHFLISEYKLIILENNIKFLIRIKMFLNYAIPILPISPIRLIHIKSEEAIEFLIGKLTEKTDT